MLWVVICTVYLAVSFYHVTYAFQSESTLYTCANVKEMFSRGIHKVWSLSECNLTWTHNYLVFKGTVNRLAKLAE